jgi:hypothetical protein
VFHLPEARSECVLEFVADNEAIKCAEFMAKRSDVGVLFRDEVIATVKRRVAAE